MNNIDAIKKFIDLILTEYDMDKKALLELWLNNTPEQTDRQNGFGPTMYEILAICDRQPEDKEDLSKLKKADLEKLCKDKGLKSTGPKATLIDRLNGKDPNAAAAPRKTKKKSEHSAVISFMKKGRLQINLKKNKHGNYEHEKTRFVFDTESMKVKGKQRNDGTICDLSKDDINVCKEYGFGFDIPPNLD